MDTGHEAAVRTNSDVNYSYATIRVTQSRIDKGLIAVPISLADRFPPSSQTIQVYLDDSPQPRVVGYSALASSAGECRIGGMGEWLRENGIQSGDEIVVQFLDLDRHVYRLVPERRFIGTVRALERDLDVSETEEEASDRIAALAQWTQSDSRRAALGELLRLAAAPGPPRRKHVATGPSRARESVPASLRVLLGAVYHGHCQICDFWFLKTDGTPYFEIHHIDPPKGHHPKNLLAVCGNCHNQFEYASVRHEFDHASWLVGVAFNGMRLQVRQAVQSDIRKTFAKEVFL